MKQNDKDDAMQQTQSVADARLKQVALRYIQDAWDEALLDGIEPEALASAALYAALSDLVKSYGEDAVFGMAKGLSLRIQRGEFTLNKTTQ